MKNTDFLINNDDYDDEDIKANMIQWLLSSEMDLVRQVQILDESSPLTQPKAK